MYSHLSSKKIGKTLLSSDAIKQAALVTDYSSQEADRSKEGDAVEVRKLSANDINKIMEFEQKHAPKEPLYAKATRANLEHVFAHPDTCRVYGIYKKEELVALGAYQTQGDEYSSRKPGIYEICGIVVHSSQRGKGLGTKIVNAIRDAIRNTQEYTEIYLTVSPQNKDALTFYSKLGFTESGYGKNVYGEGADRVYMTIS